MTATTIRPAESTSTSESQNLAKLHAMLEEPALIGFREEILVAIERLTAEEKK